MTCQLRDVIVRLFSVSYVTLPVSCTRHPRRATAQSRCVARHRRKANGKESHTPTLIDVIIIGNDAWSCWQKGERSSEWAGR